MKKVKELKSKGLNVKTIADKLNLDRRRVGKYLKSDGTWKQASLGQSKCSIVDKYIDTIKDSYLEGYSIKLIYSKIQYLGYDGSYSSVKNILTLLEKILYIIIALKLIIMII